MEISVNSLAAGKKKLRGSHVRVCPFDLIVRVQVTSQHGSRELLKNRLRKQLTFCDINEITTSGLTALNQCVLDGNLESVMMLLELGACIDKRDQYGWTALHYAANEGYLHICRFLLREGANVRVENKEGKYPVEITEDQIILRLLLRATLMHNMPPLDRDLLMQSF